MTNPSKRYQIKSRGHPKYLKRPIQGQIFRKKSFNERPEARNSDNGELMKKGWNSHLWSEIDGNCIFADGLGAIWKIFSQTSHMRPEAKVDLRGHMITLLQKVWELFERYSIRPPTWGQWPKLTLEVTWHMTALSKWYQIKSRDHPKYLKAYPMPKIQKKVSSRG